MRKITSMALAGTLAAGLASWGAIPVTAQTEEETQRGLERFRQMLREDPWSNPARLPTRTGARLLWATPARAEQRLSGGCDLGLGPGVVDRRLRTRCPRFFVRTRGG